MKAVLGAVVAMSISLISIPAAHAAFGVAEFEGAITASSGEPATQAGSHPRDVTTTIVFNTHPDPDFFGLPVADGSVKDVTVDLPPGLVGNPTTTPAKCNEGQLAVSVRLDCPLDSQVGVLEVDFATQPEILSPIYNMVPPRGLPAQFGANVGGVVVHFDARLRSDGDYGVSMDIKNTSQYLSINRTRATFWGIPADPVHDGQRGSCLINGGECPTPAPREAFLTMPAVCSGPLTTVLRTNSWQAPGEYQTASYVTHDNGLPPTPIGIDGCERLAFAPKMAVTTTTTEPDSPTGLEVDIAIPQNDNPDGLAASSLEDIAVTLPEGMTLSPSAADGLASCSDTEFSATTRQPLRCPSASRIGSVSAVSPLLDQELEGGVYVGAQRSEVPQSGEMFRIFLQLASPERGIDIRLRGRVSANPSTGRLVTTFDDNPQLPVSKVTLRLKGGPRAPLATPTGCGDKTVEAELRSWSGRVVDLSDTFTIACPGVVGFAPAFAAGTTNPVAGVFSPFVAELRRDDRRQFLSGVSVRLPEGVLARLRGVPLCDSVAAEQGGCPKESRIGTATVGAGPGANPFYLQGDVYLTEGYKGAPYGLAVHVHAKAGPYDLGWVRVRQALHVDRRTAQVSVVSDPLPQIVKGVPVRLRSVDVDVDRKDFAINPTSCAEKRVGATLTSIDGAVHRTGSRFQAVDCAALPFRPRLGLALRGKRQRTTGKHPAVRAVVRQSGVGEAGIRRARVVLPPSLALDPDNARALCEFEDGTKADLEDHCPAGSKVGRARATTPLLDRDLVGDVYFVKNVRRDPDTGNLIRTLPMLVVALRGEIAINLVGRSSTTKSGRLVNTFAGVPDAPITRFNLNIRGGKNGILAVTGNRRGNINLCVRPRSHRANTAWRGQNGKRANYRVRVKTPCGKPAKRRAVAKRKAAAKHNRAATQRSA